MIIKKDNVPAFARSTWNARYKGIINIEVHIDTKKVALNTRKRVLNAVKAGYYQSFSSGIGFLAMEMCGIEKIPLIVRSGWTRNTFNFVNYSKAKAQKIYDTVKKVAAIDETIVIDTLHKGELIEEDVWCFEVEGIDYKHKKQAVGLITLLIGKHAVKPSKEQVDKIKAVLEL